MTMLVERPEGPGEGDALQSAPRPARALIAVAARWGRAWLTRETSSRGSALLRIFLACVLWARWGSELSLHQHLTHPSISALFFVASFCLFVGLASRWAALVSGLLGLSFVHAYGIEWGYEPWAHHHTELLAFATLLLALTPCGASYSVDRWLEIGRARRAGRLPPAERGPRYGLDLLALQMSVVYVFSAYDKLNVPFLSGERLEAILGWFYWGSDFPDQPALTWLCAVGASGAVVIELGLAVGLWIRRFRAWLAPVGLALHGTFYLLFPVETFSATVACLYVAFFDQDALHAWLDELQQNGPPDAMS